MELTLIQEIGGEILVKCDGDESHRFSLKKLRDVRSRFLGPGDNQAGKSPEEYGAAIFDALFRRDKPAWQALSRPPERVLLMAEGEALQEIEWEYALEPSGYVALNRHFVRGLPREARIPPPASDDCQLRIVAVPSDPLDPAVPRLDVANEWAQLRDAVRGISADITLERVFPPTEEKLREVIANQNHLILHFMGHGEQEERGAELFFEDRMGGPHPVPADRFIQRVKSSIFLATLNACVSATPGRAMFSNLAAALVRSGVPYALGMRFSISSDDARKFSRSFYSELSRGVSVEEALHQARWTISEGNNFLIGIPVLYTSLTEPAGFKVAGGNPRIKDPRPRGLGGDNAQLIRRVHDLQELGRDLVVDDSSGYDRQTLLTVQGPYGAGKTTLAREAALRFSHAWPGGVLAVSLNRPPTTEQLLGGHGKTSGCRCQNRRNHRESRATAHSLLSRRRSKT